MALGVTGDGDEDYGEREKRNVQGCSGYRGKDFAVDIEKESDCIKGCSSRIPVSELSKENHYITISMLGAWSRSAYPGTQL